MFAYRARAAGLGTVSLCVLFLSACGGDDVVGRCIDRFNSPANEMRSYVANAARKSTDGRPAEAGFRAPVWLGESKARPEKCVGVIGLDDQAFIVIRENFNEGAEEGTWNFLPGESEGSFDQMAARVRNEPVALGNADGTIEAE